ncbi:DUF488 domain-containing protein [Trichlorobacter ammonificans]|uniref:DUF488 domain-containing protein n=1 Tax=Trichlorobacter ammonificans TaxID=2916410 RepID=A0ABM9DA75_9BACT|nr:DUF488 domain-containing protein [Trichlorobacter ammonificans]CAH2031270.1 conserved protein of unknown function [Trichlorobacter ammonificans]
MIRTKRIYDQPAADDGRRILVDRLWPRGLSREEARLDLWMREIAPSDELRRWYGHDPQRWEEFRTRYRQELYNQSQALAELRRWSNDETVTLLFAAKNIEQNNAVVVKEVVESFS